jgi:ketosteroid isomerase-like protein
VGRGSVVFTNKEGFMSVSTKIDLEARLQDLHRYIREGRILEAMHEFYANDVSMQENANPPTVGLDANIAREEQFLSAVKEWTGFEVKSIGIGNGVTFCETVFDWISTDGKPIHLEQVTVSRWRDGRITHERFYYDPAALARSECCA